ncbi:DUF6069 family protein [Pseudonocardia endophytica]|uniref:Cell envelope biogenesis protein OmpA n=1 Tax=Pseudonocardia endophytica TaxID=401976 RepID=A0A4R1HN79_PSEEN|nr:DUF6069 family protein [Pseudonocardia endophytica]TCK21810.1 hypothetical protein EV378_5801 [Pseudonocardia endophytica]
MSTTTHTAATTTVTAPSVGSLLRGGIGATVAAAAATAVVAAAGHAAGISLDMSGAPIPVSGFAVLTGIFSVVGLLIALVLRRFAGSPRTAWIRTTVVLTALSLVPDVLADAATSTKALLMVTHLVAAAIVIPAVARRLRS